MDVIVFDNGAELDLAKVNFSNMHLNYILETSEMSYARWPREVYDRIQKHKLTHIDH